MKQVCIWAYSIKLTILTIKMKTCRVSVQFSPSVMSNSLQPHGLQTPGFPVHHQLPEIAQIHVHWVGDAIQLSHPCHLLVLLPSIFPSIKVFSNESVLHIRWPKYWDLSFSISPSNEYSGLISFRIDWFYLLAVQGTLQESSPTPQFKSINSYRAEVHKNEDIWQQWNSKKLKGINKILRSQEKVKVLICISIEENNTGVGCHSLLQGIFLTQGSPSIEDRFFTIWANREILADE